MHGVEQSLGGSYSGRVGGGSCRRGHCGGRTAERCAKTSLDESSKHRKNPSPGFASLA